MRRWLADIAMLLPREGRTRRSAVALAILFAVLLGLTYGWAQRYGQALTPVSAVMVGGLALTGYGLWVLLMLTRFRRLVRHAASATPAGLRVPLTWRFGLLWPYRKGDIDRAASEGRLPELMVFCFILVTILGFSIVMILKPQPVRAAETPMTELLLKPRSSEAQILQASQRQFEDNGDPALTFSLLLPKDWLKYEPYKPENPDAKGLVLLSRYGSRDQRALLEVYTEKLGRELASADWLDVWLRENGYEVLKRHLTDTPAGWNADVLARREVKGKAFTYRMSTSKNGDRLYLVFGYAPAADYSRAEEAFVVAANSFRLPHAADVPSAEPLRTIRLSNVLPARFVFPTSWAEKRDESVGPGQDSINLKNMVGERMIGQVNVLVAPEAAYPSHGAVADALIHAAQGAVGTAIPDVSLTPVDLGSDLTDVRGGEVEVETKGSRIRIRVMVARAGRAWASFLLIGFRPQPDLYLIDAINRRAYDIAVRTFGPAS
ncbi:hypothetical protein [Inquilinus limosus]|uniref:hypothetical protein n=1 Tax=Inquilinus limosus TaxID=171674 RepID=UPI000419DBD6|nr:hypothetical protein [Inquilinus limosus]